MGFLKKGESRDPLIHIKADFSRPAILAEMNTTALLAAEDAAKLSLAVSAGANAAAITCHTVLQTPDIRVLHFAFAEGQELTRHTSSRRAVVQILTGECEFFYNEAWATLASGDLLHMPPGHPHAVRAANGAFSMLLTLGADSRLS